MDVEPTTSASLAKRVREQMVDEKKEIDQATRIKSTWEYLDELKKLQSLEIELEMVRKKLRNKELRFPDLKNLRGSVEHISEDTFWEVDDDTKKRIVAGKSLKDATEKFQKKKALERSNQEKQKAIAAQKKKPDGPN